MKNWFKNNKSFVIRSIVLIVLIATLPLLEIFKQTTALSEAYSRGFGRWLMTALAACSKYVPFSLMELMFVLAFILILMWLIKFIKQLKKKKVMIAFGNILNILIMLFTIISIDQATMSVQYSREEIPIPLYQEKVEKESFFEICKHFVDDFNDCTSKLEFSEKGDVISPYSITQLNQKLGEEYKRLNAPEFNGYFAKFTTYCKPLMSSEIFSEFWITGITYGTVGEPNIDTNTPKAGIPFTMAHELAHTKGISREDDANLTSLYLLLTSDDYFLKYSGYYSSISRLLTLGALTGNKEDYQTLVNMIDDKVFKNWDYDSLFWDRHSFFQKIGDWINDLYLKSQGTSGTSSYNDTPVVVDKETETVITFSRYQKLYFHIFYK